MPLYVFKTKRINERYGHYWNNRINLSEGKCSEGTLTFLLLLFVLYDLHTYWMSLILNDREKWIWIFRVFELFLLMAFAFFYARSSNHTTLTTRRYSTLNFNTLYFFKAGFSGASRKKNHKGKTEKKNR